MQADDPSGDGLQKSEGSTTPAAAPTAAGDGPEKHCAGCAIQVFNKQQNRVPKKRQPNFRACQI